MSAVEGSGEVGHQCPKSRRAARYTSITAAIAMWVSQRLIRCTMKCNEGEPVHGVPKRPSTLFSAIRGGALERWAAFDHELAGRVGVIFSGSWCDETL